MRTIASKTGLVLAAAALLATTACGGGGGRPSTNEIQKAIEKGNSALGSDVKVPKDTAHCVAKAFHDSKLSDGALRALVKGDKDYKASSADQKAVDSLGSDVGKCATS